ncbi:MAG TPA: DUF4157 domain-containing protein, partial [Myxococcota bacterium]|nr:DUF4157 domain-containing protein [Myxococcota bacterium]
VAHDMGGELADPLESAAQMQSAPPVQMDAAASGGDKPSLSSLHAAADSGTSGVGGSLPHLDTIQASFGAHDVGGVSAHVGGAASGACETMGANAFATGSDVAFKSTPDLHTAAHEAAHVVQQQAGVQLLGGVGKPGDTAERHADAVADAVVAGKSAEPLLDGFRGGGGGGAALQADVGLEYQTFQSDSGFYRETTLKGSDYLVKDTSHEVYAKGSGWQIENDGGDIEVVVERVPETKSGRATLQRVFSEVRAVFAHVGAGPAEAKHTGKKGKKSKDTKDFHRASSMFDEVDPGTGEAKFSLAKTKAWTNPAPGKGEEEGVEEIYGDDFFLHIADDLSAHPQVTAGFKIDKLLEAFELLGKADATGDTKIGEHDTLDDKKAKLANRLGTFKPAIPTYGRHIDTIKDTAKAVKENNVDLSDGLKGFLTIIGEYLRGWQKNDGTNNMYAKNYTPIMARTSLASVYDHALSDEERLAYSTMAGTKAGLKKLLGRMGIPESALGDPLVGKKGTKDVSGGGYETDSSVSDMGFGSAAEITVKDFLQGLGGKHKESKDTSIDLASEEFGKQAMDVQSGEDAVDLGLSEKDVKAGVTGKADGTRDAGRTKGIAVELRRLKANVGLAEWETFALAAFDLTVMINEGEDPSTW